MGKEYRAKSFKSGNSVAIRMPAALGVQPDREWTIREQNGDYVIRESVSPRRRFDIAKVAGSATNLQRIKPEDRLLEARPLLWDLPGGADNA